MQRCVLVCYEWKLPFRMEVLHSLVALAQSAATQKWSSGGICSAE